MSRVADVMTADTKRDIVDLINHAADLDSTLGRKPAVLIVFRHRVGYTF